jgi:hypothetical protein
MFVWIYGSIPGYASLCVYLLSFMVVTIKHSGSLVTLSSSGFAAKNSLDNAFTSGAALLLVAHYMRLKKEQRLAEQQLLALMGALKERRMAISFEMVTGERNKGGKKGGKGAGTLSAENIGKCFPVGCNLTKKSDLTEVM